MVKDIHANFPPLEGVDLSVSPYNGKHHHIYGMEDKTTSREMLDTIDTVYVARKTAR